MTDLCSGVPVQFACNAHTICDEEVRPLGTGLYPVISIINHRFGSEALFVRKVASERILVCHSYGSK